ncbi:MAG: hypothetical protein HQL58_00305 [Magnetococcales bacterium]|nr:hypothetical protein [Magnetococcales bacterium]
MFTTIAPTADLVIARPVTVHPVVTVQIIATVGLCVVAILVSSCSSSRVPLPPPATLQLPAPQSDRQSGFVSPCNSSCELTEWAVKINRHAKLGETISQKGGELVGQALRDEHVPFAGTMGERMGQKLGHKAILLALGGMKRVREQSSVTFERMEDMAVDLYGRCGHVKHYPDALRAVALLYPGFESQYQQAIVNAPRRQVETP